MRVEVINNKTYRNTYINLLMNKLISGLFHLNCWLWL